MPVIGIAGGVGSGKSAVSRVFEELGCLVSDSDRATRAALEREDVREQLVSWWGRGVLDADGRVDRVAIAKIVFADSAERARLESVTHPAARADRDAVIARAEAEGAAGVVVDAPLLFEVGLDASCDFVVFVDAPLVVRAERVRSTRGWDEARVAEREAAQLPVDEKRSRSDAVVDNSGSLGGLRRQVESVLARAVERHRAERAAR